MSTCLQNLFFFNFYFGPAPLGAPLVNQTVSKKLLEKLLVHYFNIIGLVVWLGLAN
jgi:hypothetical protein